MTAAAISSGAAQIMGEAQQYAFQSLRDEAKNLTDRVALEKNEDAMLYILTHPLTSADPIEKHREYRAKAYEALCWADKNLSTEEYKKHLETYRKYLKDTTPKDDGAWSSHRFYQRYSMGSPDLTWEESATKVAWATAKVVASATEKTVAKVVNTVSGAETVPYPTSESTRDMNSQERQHDAACHEYDFRVKYGLDTEGVSPHVTDHPDIVKECLNEAGSALKHTVVSLPGKTTNWFKRAQFIAHYYSALYPNPQHYVSESSDSSPFAWIRRVVFQSQDRWNLSNLSSESLDAFGKILDKRY